jgi:pimeloyl-ACP methyl ester carboxylesterase
MSLRIRVLSAVAAGTVVAGFSLAACSKPAPPAPVVPIASCVTEDQQREQGLTLTRPDGVEVDALRYGSGTTALVLANQVDGDLCGWEPYSEIWASKGYQVLVFNYSGRDRAADDVLTGIAAVRQQGATHVFPIGASKGGTAAIAAASEAQPAVDGVVSLSGPQVYGSTNAISAMPKLTVPALFVAGQYDTQFADAAQAFYAAAATTDKQLVIRQNANHGYALLSTDTLTLIQTFITDHGGSAA